MPKLSIVIMTYNRLTTLKRAIASALATPSNDIEVVVSDNASPDGTCQYLESLDDPRLRHWTHPTNIGPCLNFMSVLTKARGEYVLWLTDDDYMLPGGVEAVLSVLYANPDLGAMLCRLKVVDEQDSHVSNYRPYKRNGRHRPGMEALSKLLWATHTLSGIVVRREWVDIAGTERHLDSYYPQMFAVGSVLREHPGYSLDTSVIAHTTGNAIYWSYTQDFMACAQIALIKDLLQGDRWAAERRVLVDQIIEDIVKFHLALSWEQSPEAFRSHQQALMACPEVANAPRYWQGVAHFLERQQRRRPTLLMNAATRARGLAKQAYLRFSR